MNGEPLKAAAALLFTVSIWGIGPVFIRSVSLALGPPDALVIRYALTSVLFLVILSATGFPRIARADWPRLLATAWIGLCGYNLGSVFGFELVSASVGGLVIGTQPLLIALLAAFIVGERLTWGAVAGFGLAIAGIALLFWDDLSFGLGSSPVLLGGLYIFLSGLAWAFYVVMARPLIGRYGAFNVTASTLVIGALPLFAMARPSTLDAALAMGAREWADMAFLVVPSTLMATVAWNYGTARLSSAAGGAFLYLVPVIAVAAGATMLGEPVTAKTIAGGALVLLGVAAAQASPWLARADRRSTGALAVLFAVVMWGLVPVAVRYLVTTASPEAALLLRLFPAGVVALLILAFMGMRPIDARDWPRLVSASVFGYAGYQVLANFGQKTVPAAWTGMIFGLEAVFVALFAVVLAGERLTVPLVAGLAIALLGTAALMFGSTAASVENVGLGGLALVTISTMGWGLYAVLLRPLVPKYGSFETSCLTLGICAVPMLAFITPDLPATIVSLDAVQIGAIVFLAIPATILAVSAWNFGAARMTNATAGMFLYVQPVVAALGGMLILGERMEWPLLVGGGLIILGVAVSQYRALPESSPA